MPAAVQVPPQTRLGAYEVLGPIAVGGMSSVYYGRSVVSGERVALKITAAQPMEKELRRLFDNEARILRLVRHPNVVALLDAGEQDGFLYLALEYVGGPTLSEITKLLRRREHRMGSSLAVWLVGEVAAGLHAAHELAGDAGRRLQVVHRDISPQNVLVSRTGDVKLIDFGVAKAEDVHTRGTIKGKVSYMAPEQLRGQPLNRRADIFALGVLLWELLAGRRRFEGMDDIETLHALDENRAPDLSALPEDLPYEVTEVLTRVFATDPGARPESAWALRRALRYACPLAARPHRAELIALLRHFEDDLATIPVVRAELPEEAEEPTTEPTTQRMRRPSGTRPRLTPAVGTRARPSLLDLLHEARPRPELVAKQEELEARLAELASRGPKTTPFLHRLEADRRAYVLDAFLTLARVSLARAKPGRERGVGFGTRSCIDGEQLSLVDLDQELGLEHDPRIYALVREALGHADPIVLAADQLDATLSGALERLVADPSWLHVDHPGRVVRLPPSARTQCEIFANLTTSSTTDNRFLLGLAAVAKGPRADALLAAHARHYRIIFESPDGEVTPRVGDHPH